MSNWPSSTRAILASGQPRRPRTRASAWRWSSCQEPAKASFFYRVDGLWNGSSPGLPGSVASPGTMKDCWKPWKDCTSSLSPASCSPEAAVSSHSSLQALMGPNVEAIHTPEGLRAVSRGKPIKPAAVRKYLAGKFGDALSDVQGAMEALATSMPPEELARQAFGLYEEFRPAVKSGAAGWGQEGKLDLAQIRNLCGKKS